MATQTTRSTRTSTQRKASATKAAATRKRRSAQAGATRTRSSARSTAQAARQTGRAAGATARNAGRTAARSTEATSTRLSAVARQAERAVLIPVGAALEARDALRRSITVYTSRRETVSRMNRFERRGERALRRNRREFETALQRNRRDLERRVRGIL